MNVMKEMKQVERLTAEDLEAVGFEALPNYCLPDEEQQWLHKEVNVVLNGYPRNWGELFLKLCNGGYAQAFSDMRKLERGAGTGRDVPLPVFFDGE